MDKENIKKALECCLKPVDCNNCPYDGKCKRDELEKDILTLINELESENERLMKLQARGGCRVAELGIENQQLKDRIAELEKENGELLKENEGYHGSYRCAIDKIGELSAERYIKVEQFAERLKENDKIKVIFNDGWMYSYFEICKAIDETLKEFINKGDEKR